MLNKKMLKKTKLKNFKEKKSIPKFHSVVPNGVPPHMSAKKNPKNRKLVSQLNYASKTLSEMS